MTCRKFPGKWSQEQRPAPRAAKTAGPDPEGGWTVMMLHDKGVRQSRRLLWSWDGSAELSLLRRGDRAFILQHGGGLWAAPGKGGHLQRSGPVRAPGDSAESHQALTLPAAVGVGGGRANTTSALKGALCATSRHPLPLSGSPQLVAGQEHKGGSTGSKPKVSISITCSPISECTSETRGSSWGLSIGKNSNLLKLDPI